VENREVEVLLKFSACWINPIKDRGVREGGRRTSDSAGTLSGEEKGALVRS